MVLKIAIVAGEASGDRLGAELMQAMRQKLADKVEFEGVGGPLMEAQGMTTLFPIEALSVMGLGAILRRLPKLLHIRSQLVERWQTNKPDIFIGIDAPEFNLSLEQKLKASGIPVVHYVCPTIWAWRPKRIQLIQRAVDHLLALFPFEVPILEKAGVAATCVGHPMVAELKSLPTEAQIREELGLAEKPVLAILPGSRATEVSQLGDMFLRVAHVFQKNQPHWQAIVVAANGERYEQLQGLFSALPTNIRPQVKWQLGHSRKVLKVASAAILASGTASLEAAMLDTPHVAAYRLPRLSYALFSRMLQVKQVTLPNLLLETHPVPELLQNEATVDNLVAALQNIIAPAVRAKISSDFRALWPMLDRGGNELAAEVVIKLMERG
ncbi:MAG: lipid-A-disaccharide synthase [Gammaproteobacteria bacterium]|nr:MAG: lipid-A-disaccharide synthase [Gammaproteobacteria bacterium]